MNNSSLAVCVASDAAYAFPTAVVASAVVQRQAPGSVAVYYIWVDAGEPPRELPAYLEKSRIVFVNARNCLRDFLQPAHPGYLSRASAARLHIAAILEKFSIDRFLYLDGDIQILGALDNLARIDLPNGAIATADDFGPLLGERNPQVAERHRLQCRDLGMPDGATYFNAGVILGRMQSWAGISSEARRFLAENAGICLHFDQCALNAVAFGSRATLSPKWNFQAPLFRLGVEAEIKPSIVHFLGHHKPWASVPLARPWQARRPFRDARTEMPVLWKRTALRATLRGSIALCRKTLKQRLGARKDSERNFFLEYVGKTEFIDGLGTRP